MQPGGNDQNNGTFRPSFNRPDLGYQRREFNQPVINRSVNPLSQTPRPQTPVNSYSSPAVQPASVAPNNYYQTPNQYAPRPAAYDSRPQENKRRFN